VRALYRAAEPGTIRRVEPKPPPPPVAANRPPPPPPPPGASAKPAQDAASLIPRSTTQAKADIAAVALRLRDEQIQAKIVYFGADQKTNSELDAITEQVIAELRALQNVTSKPVAEAAEDRSQLEIELIQSLRSLLEKLFSARREGFLRRKIEVIQRRITTLFFNSELYTKISAGSKETRTFAWPEQAMYYVVRKQKEALLTDLKSLQYSDSDVRDEAINRLNSLEASLRMEVLSRTTPELEKLLAIYCDEIVHFLRSFRDNMGEFCWEVIRESRAAHGKLFGYKVPTDKFPAFREVFDKKFLQRLVTEVQEPVLKKAGEMKDTFRDETRRFVADPHIFSEICAVLCDAVYDYLHTEGFLDLPPQWRAHLDRHSA
jgi:hypothetical protein